MFKSAVSNIIELEIGRLKSIIESKLKSLRGAADSGENGGTNSADSQEAPAYYEEFAKTMAARADEHRLAMEERMENIAELIKRPPAPSSPAEQTDAPAMREQLEKLLPYLRDEFSAIAAKLENISKPGETKGALAIASDSKNAPADTPDSENAPADASDSEDAPADAPTAENADAMREQLEKLSLYLHDEFAAVAAKLENISKPGETIAPDTAADTAAHENAAREQLEKLSSSMHEKFAAVAAKLENMPAPAADHSMLLEMLNQSMNRLSGEVDAKLTLLNGKLEKHMETRWSDALASINTLREQIENLSNAGEQIKSINQNMTSLSRLMLVRSGVDEQGARQQLSELLTQILSAEHFMLDVDLPNGHCAAAMVRFPDPKDSVSIDAGLSLASFIESLDETLPASERDSKRQTFRQELVSHINHVADNLISPPHTGESAL
ncbi:MAG: DNA recombination protein RmuC, partial [Betaproteobacteria bacterium]|nr:DNA recombination protein RmuC [Betaproteobacteria bacterium]